MRNSRASKRGEGGTKFKNRKTQHCQNVVSPGQNLQVQGRRDLKVPAGFCHGNRRARLPSLACLRSCPPPDRLNPGQNTDRTCNRQGVHEQAGGRRSQCPGGGNTRQLPVPTASSLPVGRSPPRQGRCCTNQTPAPCLPRELADTVGAATRSGNRGASQRGPGGEGGPRFCS